VSDEAAVEVEPGPAGHVAHFAGELDLASVPAIQRDALAATAAAHRVVLDLSEVTWMDSTGLRMLDDLTRAYEGRSTAAKTLGRPLRALSGGRLLRRAYVPGSDPGIIDSLVPQQGPNYALAKRLQRWRAVLARHQGETVSMNVAPPTRTKSVVRNRALAAAYAGAHRFGVEVFEPSTSNVLMAALLVHDLHTDGGPRHEHPWQDEAFAAVHGGLWRAPYAPRSALGLAALLGFGAARG